MCELLALSSSQPVELRFSLRTLAERGGPAGHLHDGWGVAFYQGADVALFREPTAAGGSALVHHLESQVPATTLAISHIRHATRGGLSLANTQPFVRELGGQAHVFAHNGDLPGIFGSGSLVLDRYRPIGQTDSEHAFCALLARLEALWQADGTPSLDARLGVLSSFAAELRTLGPANFLYADGDALFAHGHRRMQTASGRAEPPGLWTLARDCEVSPVAAQEFGGLSVEPLARSTVLLASVPLCDQPWRPLAEGEILVVREGKLLV